MTDEEMADEYASKYGDDNHLDFGNIQINLWPLRRWSFLDGLKAGKPKWHDLQKNPDDLPKEGEIVLCYCLGYCGASYPITARMHVDYENPHVHYWWTLGGEGHSEKLDNVLAWQEIAIPMGIMDKELKLNHMESRDYMKGGSK